MELGDRWSASPTTIPTSAQPGNEDPPFIENRRESIQQIYEDIKTTLRVSIVNLPFTVWARQPPLLEFFWKRLKPNLATRYVESAADRIRERAVRTITGRFRLRELKSVAEHDFSAIRLEQNRFLVDIHHYANPKLLIATAGLLEAMQGHPFEPVRDRRVRERVPAGIPADMPKVLLQDEPDSPNRDTALLEEIQELLVLPVPSSDYVCLSCINGNLDKIWSELKQIIKTDTYWQLAEDLASLATLLVRGLPFSIPMGREQLKTIGMTLFEARNWIIPSHLALTKLVLNMAALKVALDGKEEALRSPYPIIDAI